MFLLLGLTNAGRNLARSALAIVGFAVAAMIMTSILGLSGGYPAGAHLPARAFMGADIVIYATRHLVSPDDLRRDVGAGSAAGREWALTSLSPDLVCDLCSLHPELYTAGFLSPGGLDVAPIDVVRLRETLIDQPPVRFVNPSYFLPVRMTYVAISEEGLQETIELPGMVLRSRDFIGQAEKGGWPFEVLDAGAVPGNGDQHARLALLDAQLPLLEDDCPGRGVRVLIHVPSVSVAPDGRWRYDFTSEKAFDFTIHGTYRALTNRVDWSTERGSEFEDLYWTTTQIQIPAGTFEDIFREVSGGALPQHALQVGLAVAPFSELEDIAAELRAALPEYSVISVPRQMALAHAQGLPEAVYRAPLDVLGRPSRDQVGLPVDLGNVFAVLSCLIGGLLLASNMSFLLSQRRREVGVLRALGAKGRDIAVMILGEGLTLSLIGAVAGFVAIRLLVTWTLVSNRIPVEQIASATARHFGLVVGAAAAAAVFFGLIPAWQMSRLTSMEVLRNE